jgi:hypothetical protein
VTVDSGRVLRELRTAGLTVAYRIAPASARRRIMRAVRNMLREGK